MSVGTWASIINLTICFAIPLMLVALGGMYSERSGVINLALEGIMIIGALASTLFLRALDAAGWGESVFTSQLGVALAALIAGVAGMLFSLLLAFAAINLKADQTIGGTALNLFAPAFCVVVAWAIQGQGITDISIPTWTRWTPEQLHIMGTVNQDFLPSLFKKIYITIPIALILFLVAWFVLYRTRFGLRMRACGEHPQAADSVGINVYKMRYAGVMISGFLGGIGGRLDHTVANFAVLYYLLRRGARAVMADTHNRVELKLPGSYRLEPEEGYKFSLFPYAGEVTGLTERQVYYPLDNATLTPDNPLGVSNEFLRDPAENTLLPAEISFKSGVLMIFLSKD